MPICACESTVHLYGYRPALRVTVSRVVLPGEIVFDVCPAIAKSCDVWPEFTITNVTRPLCTVCFESTNEKSFAVTWTVVVAVAAGAAAPAKAANARSAAAGTTASLGFISTSLPEARRTCRKGPRRRHREGERPTDRPRTPASPQALASPPARSEPAGFVMPAEPRFRGGPIPSAERSSGRRNRGSSRDPVDPPRRSCSRPMPPALSRAEHGLIPHERGGR